MANDPRTQALIDQGYGGYAGWGGAEAEADFKATGGAGKQTSGGGSSYSTSSYNSVPNMLDSAKQVQQFQLEANQPAIESLKASIPEIQNIFQTQSNYLKSQQPLLEKRYDDIIKSITSSTTMEVGNEFGKRGIPAGSGLYEQTLNNRLNPQLSELQIGREQDISGLLNSISELGGQEVTSLRDVQNSIAQLMAGNAPNAVQSALGIIQNAQNQTQIANNYEIDKLKLAQTGKPTYSTVSAGGRVLMIDSDGNIVKDLGASSTGGGNIVIGGGDTGTGDSDWERVQTPINTGSGSGGGMGRIPSNIG